jgi:hypothetical protein
MAGYFKVLGEINHKRAQDVATHFGWTRPKLVTAAIDFLHHAFVDPKTAPGPLSEFVKTAKSTHGSGGITSALGLKEALLIPLRNVDFLNVLNNSERVTLIGHRFAYLAHPELLTDAVNQRLSKKRYTTIITPPPNLIYGDNALEHQRSFFSECCKNNWTLLEVDSKNGHPYFTVFEYNSDISYSALITEAEVWFRPNLSGTLVSPLFFVGAKTDGISDIYHILTADIAEVISKSVRLRFGDLAERFGPVD